MVEKTKNTTLTKQQIIIRCIPTIIFATLIFYMSSRPGTDMQPSGIFGDIIQFLNNIQIAIFGSDLGLTMPFCHFCEYAILTILVLIPLSVLPSPKRIIMHAICIVSFYALSDEIHQYFVPGRTCDIYDWFVDIAACIVVTIIWFIIFGRRKEAKEDFIP